MGWWIAALAAVCGFQAMAVQALFLREAVVLMSGSELAWGMVLGSWLLGIAIGGAAGGCLASRARRPEAWLTGLLPGVSAAGLAALWAFRGGRGWLGVTSGELLPLEKMLLAAGLLVPPASMLVGMTFPFLCAAVAGAGRDARIPGRGAGTLGRVYALESAGSLIGGAWISFWVVEHLDPVQTLLACGTLAMAATAGALLSARDPSPALRACWRPLGASVLGVISVGLLALAAVAGGRINDWLIERRWQCAAPGYARIAERETRYQNLALGWRDGQFTLMSDGQVSASFPDPYSAAPLAHLCMCEHPRPQRVLLIGGVAEGLLSEILLHPVERVDCIEPDPREIDLIEPHLDATARQALADPRVVVHHQDARHSIKMQRGQFDLVIARTPEPTSAMRARFYTREFYLELRRALAADAVLCLTAPAAPTRLSGPSREYLASLRATLQGAFPYVMVSWGDPAWILAATRDGLLSVDPNELARRYVERGVRSEVFSPLWFEGAVDSLDPAKIRERAAELDSAGPVAVSTDLRPVVYLQRLELLEHATGTSPKLPLVKRGKNGDTILGADAAAAGARGAVARLRSMRLTQVIAALGALGLVVLLISRLRAGRRGGWGAGAVVLSVGSTGFTTMALSIIWLFAFQNLYGYVYARVGWIIALFMAGLMAGSAWEGRRAARVQDGTGGATRHRLIAVDFAQAALAVVVPIVLMILGALPGGGWSLGLIEVVLSLMVAITGFLCGAAFALAGAVRLAKDGRVGTAAGVVVWADHAGACLGALLTGMLLVPVFGIPAAAAVLAGAKAVSGLVLLMTGPRNSESLMRGAYRAPKSSSPAA